MVILYEPGQVSVLNKGIIEDSKEVSSAEIFILEADGQILTFSYNDRMIVANETGSEWDVFGRVISGELEGVNTFQF